MSDDSVWPKKGRKAFVGEAVGKSFTLINQPWNNPRLAKAFHVAAQMVISGSDEADWHTYIDELFFPAVYLYRHAFELRMKDLIRTGIALSIVDEAKAEEVLSGHNLMKLWNLAKQVIVYRWPDGDSEPVKAAEVVIQECHQADPDGQAFRYSTDKAGRRRRHERLPQTISLKELQVTMDGVFKFLNCTADELEHNLSDMLSSCGE